MTAPDQNSVFTALEAIRKGFESHTALQEDHTALRNAFHDAQSDAKFYKERLDETLRERDDLLILSTQLCERVAIADQVLSEAKKLATKFSQELSARGLDRESRADPSPVAPDASQARRILEEMGREEGTGR